MGSTRSRTRRSPRWCWGGSSSRPDPDLSYDEYFDTERYWQWCAEHLPHLDEQVLDWVTSTAFDRVLRDTVKATYPAHEQHAFLDHFHGLVDLWVVDEAARLRTGTDPSRLASRQDVRE